MQIKSFRDLAVWQSSIELVVEIYALSRLLPADERFGLSLQLRRAAVSIPSNIAEGSGYGAAGGTCTTYGSRSGRILNCRPNYC